MSDINYSNLNNKTNNCYNISHGFFYGSSISIIIVILTILLITSKQYEDGSNIK